MTTPQPGARLRLLLRTALALPMIASGIVRLIPVWVPPLRPFDQLQRLGELTQGELLRTLVGASPLFQSFTGLAALLGGVLLLFPRTTLLGAVICAANLAMAVTLAFCYDLPSKIYVCCLFLLSLALLAPDLRRLVTLFFLDRAVEPPRTPPAASGWPDRVLQLLGVGVIVWGAAVGIPRLIELHPPKPPFYGVWNVEELTIDGEESDDPRQWARAVFQDPGALDVELRIGSRTRHALDLDSTARTMTLDGRFRLAFQEPKDDVLVLEGQLDGRPMRAELRRVLLSSPWLRLICDYSRFYE
ncbi:MAG TPA: hypothetical protein VFR31_11945 [Thermoanaerobaculia bacterium]|nr:hypothetical protein [Thermoanaerobaculia bacterium]